ncbi:MAG: SDR family oxidoreductase [Hyphomonas sp.]|uniref:SDR family NAD(P)-dependent oxidoreductase n=1 Tax=Hyphomonas sp. TaxID=87 RepID=UPI0017F3C4F7|nr:SDR family oxidoreductase [Hyphomonas sp.]MBU3920453.1 SDR family oxidoreductase [Alphaproteobacteria bacterium]MBA3069968.1 SDR family oxidoreductase [Hyphomonas sp.]MBU4060456.1 SDR family oxidoreductase [Alphaproteobacteria bacterium]MBU4163124.1 SDR family oxidoreductase [Alphaproteobacteria bacterium]MBU4568520.1 SDR family oxidoreductase [Alphaproteobacteria bacterium]
MSLFSLANKTALVTGASSGLGRHFAQVLADAGATVVVAARRMDRLEEVAAEISKRGGKALPIELDVTSDASVTGAFSEIKEALGRPCDIIINNSGMSREGWYREQSEDDWNAVIDTNLTGVWRVGKHGTNAMIEAGVKGAIVNIASITAHRTQLMTAAYCVSKAGVDHLTRHMALEGARYGIRVNAISPGYYKTAINDDYLDSEAGEAMRKRVAMRRFGEYRELDGALLLLTSEAGSYMTGSTIVVDGGHLLAPL